MKPSFSAAVDERRANTSGGRTANANANAAEAVGGKITPATQPTANADATNATNAPKKPIGGGGKKGFVGHQTMSVLNTIIGVLTEKYMNKDFTIRQLLDDLPVSLKGAWRAEELELNRLIQRILQMKPIDARTNASGRGRPVNIFHFSGPGSYVEKKLFGTGPTSPLRDANGKRISKRELARQEAEQRAAQGESALDTVRTTRPYTRRQPVQTAPAKAMDAAPASMPANVADINTARKPSVPANYEEAVMVDGVTYYLGGDSNLARRTGNDPKSNRFAALVFDKTANAPLQVNGDIVRLPKKSKK